ncbi:cullin-4A-like [Agrilus planipennis]|uniref:Cullin-4 n=1 Tax=Agrilus planipennis TaxID=224129 RepID=A0A1W4XT43_AGRPL|nr:cullin-4A-like [Agrilus planipennis]
MNRSSTPVSIFGTNKVNLKNFNRSSDMKKIFIKKFRGNPVLPPNYYENTWNKLRDAIISIQNSSILKYSLEELYGDVESMCIHNMSHFLYDNLYYLVENHVGQSVSSFLNDSLNDPQEFLTVINNTWVIHCKQMSTIRNIFIHLDRTYVLHNVQTASIWDMGLDLFRQYIIRNCLVKTKITDALLLLIKQERDANTIDRDLIRSIIRMLTILQIYKPVFEEKFYTESENMYAAEANYCIKNFDLPEYLSHVRKRFKEEYNRGNQYLDSGTMPRLITIIEKNFIADQIQKTLDKGLNKLLDSRDHYNLSLLYLLLGRVKSGHAELCAGFNSYMKQYGRNVVSHPENDKNMVKMLLDFKDAMDDVVAKCFEKNEKFTNSLKEAFEYFINLRINAPAELVAKFIDSKLRIGNKESTDEELEILLDKIMVLFRFIHGKDVFEAFYKKDLAKRLLFGKSASVDYEKSMLSKLKEECGGGFTSKLEGMFKDMELSKDINGAFKQHLSHSLNNTQDTEFTPLDMTVNTLTMGYWPTYPIMNVVLPEEMLRYQEIFNNFYLSKHSGRKLAWQPTLGYCVVRAQFKVGIKELLVSLLQTLVLLLFNGKNELSYEYIKGASNIEDLELKRTLQSLACGKTRVLLKRPKGRDVEDTDYFMYNADFKNKLFRVTVNQIQMKETTEEQKATEERVFQDRQYQIDAAIVRIMKTHKALSHNTLVSELCLQLKFPVTLADLKKRIESLIERDYMERDKEIQNQYNYL